ncbi:Regulatory protein BlaR1 [Gimesia panareensis]|uniref:Regulatory protein BlaR1 n=1 Tax=Gimesia panareensis TaxID=2527978 RepID=A0A517Q413_9PLAN|nr:M56 family metallopeptidase [Gimesia panareensis]QDT26365.1 Regulatory protein BlaR1 [Gimesia panareensis]
MIDHSLALRLTFTLAHSLWISSILAISVWLLCRFVIRSAGFRYHLWLCALAGSIAALPVTFLVLPGKIVPHSPASANVLSQSPETITELPAAPIGQPVSQDSLPAPASQQSPTPSVQEIAQHASHSPASAMIYWPECLVACWILGMLLMSVRLIRSLNQGRLLKYHSQLIEDTELQALFQRCLQRLQLTHNIILARSERLSVPVLIGFLRPMILLPLSTTSGLSPQQLEALLLHELMHLKRLDPWVNHLQLIVESICFYNPAVWVISRNLRSEREYCCDDAVLKLGTVDAVDYADTLLLIAERATRDEPVPATLLGVALKRISQLGNRIDRILTPNQSPRSLLPAQPLLALLILLALITGIVTHGVQASAEPQAATQEEREESKESEQQRYLKMLQDSDPYVRVTALNALGETVDASLVPIIVPLLQDSNSDIRMGAARFLGDVKDPDTISPLIAALQKTQDPNEIIVLIRALSNINDPRAIEPIVKVLQQVPIGNSYSLRPLKEFNDPRINELLLKRVGKNEISDFNLVYLLIEMDERRLIPPLLSQLNETDIRREATIAALGRFHAEEAVIPIIKNLDSESERVRHAAIKALANINDKRAVEPLLALIQREKDPRNLRELCTTLSQLGDPRAMPALEKLTSHEDRWLKNTALESLSDLKLRTDLASSQSDTAEKMKIIRAALRQKDEHQVLAALRYLSHQKGEQKIELLKPLLQHDNKKVQARAINILLRDQRTAATEALLPLLEGAEPSRTVALALAEREDRRALPVLLKMAHDQNQYTRRAAAEHLYHYGQETIPVLCELLKSDDQHTRRAALSSLVRIADERALEPLLAYAETETKDSARNRVLNTLGRINHPRSITYLKSQLMTPSQYPSYIAAQSLTKLGWKPETREERIRYLIATGQSDDKAVPRTKSVHGTEVGKFELNVPIQTHMTAETPEYGETVFLSSIEFRDSDGTLTAKLHGGINSWPAATFRLTLRLFDQSGKQISKAQQDIKTPGFIISVVMRSKLPETQLDLGQVDLKQVEHFEMTLQKVPRAYSENLSLSSPVETDFAPQHQKPLALTAQWGPQTVLKTESLTLQPVETSPKDRHITYNVGINVLNSGGLNADWRFWIVALNDDHQIIGRGSQTLKSAATVKQDKTPEIISVPLQIWNKTSSIKQIRVGLELTKVNTGIKNNRITEVAEQVVPESAEPLILDDGTAETYRSLAASGHAVRYHRPDEKQYLEAIRIFASRYGTPTAPQADFRLYVLDENQKIITDLKFPYALIPRGDLKWHTLRTPSIEVPDQFYIALAFNPHRTKGIYIGRDDNAKKTDSFIGLPGDGLTALKPNQNWMVRPCLSPQPTEQLGLRKLADRVRTDTIDPFAGCIEVRNFVRESQGQQSYGGAGPAMVINVKDLIPAEIPIKQLRLKGIQLYSSRYGSGYEPETTGLDLQIVDQKAAASWSHSFSYDQFGYRPKWVNLVIPDPPPIADYLEQGKLTLGLDPHATQYKGVYFHYAKVAESEPPAQGFVPGKRFFDVPGRQWAIRVFLTKQK